MRLETVHVKNFKAIKDVEFALTDVTLLVGTNNSGKSSLLQAIHFATRSLSQASEANKQSTISLRDLEYVPSELYWELAHNDTWGNRRDQPESHVAFQLRDTDHDGNQSTHNASVSLKSARNEGIAVNPEIDARIIPQFRTRNALFSAYIPGIAGIPLQETFLSKRHVYRKAASGDSNVVLRNILYLLSLKKELNNTIRRIQEVYGDKRINFTVSFDNNSDYHKVSNDCRKRQG